MQVGLVVDVRAIDSEAGPIEGQHLLPGTGVVERVDRAQRLVPRNHVTDRLVEGVPIERSRQFQGK